MSDTINKFKAPLAEKRGDNPAKALQPILSEALTNPKNRLERRFLASMFENSNHCIRPLCKRYKRDSYDYMHNKLFVSSISLSLNYVAGHPEFSHYEFVDNVPYKHLTYSDNIRINQFEELVIKSIEESINKTASDRNGAPILISINEFGFPFFRQEFARDKFINKIKEISIEKNAYILCGTSHCFMRKKNIAIFAHPHEDNIIEHPKYSPAINLGEVLAPREDLKWEYYSMAIGRLAILICFDAIDPNVILRQTYYSRDMMDDKKINIFLIPAFSMNDYVRDQAEMLSFMTKSIVIYTNHQYVDQSQKSGAVEVEKRCHGIFIAGEDMTDEVQEENKFSSYVKHLCEFQTNLPLGDSSIWASQNIVEIDYRQVTQELLSLKDDFSPLFQEILSLAKRDPTKA